MSSSSTAYIVAPNSATGTSSTIPSPTQLNGAGALVDLVPTILTKGAGGSSVPLSNTSGVYTTLFTFPSALAPGTYIINYNLECQTGTPTATNWNTNEYVYTEVYTSTSFPADWSAVASFTPYYQSYNPPTGGVFFPVSGFLELSSTLTPIIRIGRQGTLSTSKTGLIIFASVQKIA